MAASVRIAPRCVPYQYAASHGCRWTYASKKPLHRAAMVKRCSLSSLSPFKTAQGALCGVELSGQNEYRQLTPEIGASARRIIRASACGSEERSCFELCWPIGKSAAKQRTGVPCRSLRSPGNASEGSNLEREGNGGEHSPSLGNGEEDARRGAVSAESSDGSGGQGLPHAGNLKIDNLVDAAGNSPSSPVLQQPDNQDLTLPGPLTAADIRPGGGTSYAYEGRSYEWRLQQAARVVALQLQNEGVEASEAVRIAAAAPLYCQSLVDKVSEMDGPPDIWEELGLLDGGEESVGRNLPLEGAGESADNEEEASISGRPGAKLTAAFANAYELSGVPEPPPREKRERARKGKKAAGGGPGGVEATPRSRRKREWKLRGLRRRAEQQSELEELLGIGPTRGEPYRLAEWEREQAAMENGSEEELDSEGGNEGERSKAGGEALYEDGSVGGGMSQGEAQIEGGDGVNRGAVSEGSLNGGDVGGVNGLEGAGAGLLESDGSRGVRRALDRSGEGAHENLANWQGSEGEESSGSGLSGNQDANADSGLGSALDLNDLEASVSVASDSSPQSGDVTRIAAEGLEAGLTEEDGGEKLAEAAYCWKLQWCADERRGGGALLPFFESVGVPPNESKRIVRELKRSRGPKGRVILPITEVVTRVRVFERLLGTADGLGAAERILVKGRDETLSRMREDDDIERNVRYLEAAVAAIRGRDIRAAGSTSVADPSSDPSSNPSSGLNGSFRNGSDEVGNQQNDLSLGCASYGDNQSESLESGEQDSLSGFRQNQSASTHVESGLRFSSAALEAIDGTEPRELQDFPPSSKIEGMSSNTNDRVSSANPPQYGGNPAANPSANPVTESESAPLNPSDSSPTTAEPRRETPDQPLTPANPASRGLGQAANQQITPANPYPNPVTQDSTLDNPNPNPEIRKAPWGASLVVSSFPELLFSSLETKNFEMVAEYMEHEVGMTSAEAANALLLFPPAFALDVETELKPRMRDLKSILRISWPDLARMIGRWPYVLSETASVAAIPTVDFLYREALVAIDAVGKLVAGLPHILFCDINGLLRPSLQLLLNVGVQHKRAHIGLVVTKCPQALLKGPARLAAVIDFLETEADVPPTRTEKVLLTIPELLGTRLEVPREKLDFLYDLGLTEGQVGKVVRWKPRVLLTSVQGLEERVSFFERLGLSRHEVAHMVEQFPDLLTYSVRGNFQPKVDYLVNEMGRPVDELVNFPRFFSFSLDTRIKPRHEGARAAGSFDRFVSIGALLTPNDVRFREAFLGAREQQSAMGRDQSNFRPGGVKTAWRSGRSSRDGRVSPLESRER